MAWSAGEKKNDMKRTATSKVVEMRPSAKGTSGEVAAAEKLRSELSKEKDLVGGMEMLELDFLLGVVENTRGDDTNDVTMRRLSFNELHRREQLDAIDSNALKFYAINEGNLYGKSIQCEAMKKLAERTTHKSKDSG